MADARAVHVEDGATVRADDSEDALRPGQELALIEIRSEIQESVGSRRGRPIDLSGLERLVSSSRH